MKLLDLAQRDVVYLSGPMTGQPEFNKPAFDAMQTFLVMSVGCSVLSPARHPDGWDYADYMRRAMADLLVATAVVVLPGADKSRGARYEIATAEILGLPVIVAEGKV